ncbi:MAG: hypothetical protein WC514_02160 [Candidatus Paceibacterota bacterium]
MRKLLLSVLVIILLVVGLFILKEYMEGKEKQTIPVANQASDQGGVMQFTAPSE